MDTVLYAFEIAVALGLIIFVHELGHFLAAKWCGVWVRRFAIGFGPPLIKWTRGETEYSLRILPLGGFVEPMGDSPEGEGGDSPRALWRKPAWQKILIFAAGVLMNALLAMILFGLAPIVGLEVSVPVVGQVFPESPADEVGLKPGDRVVSINGETVHSFEDISSIVGLSNAGTEFDVKVERPVSGAAEPREISFTVASTRAPGSLAPMLGFMPEMEPVIAAMNPTMGFQTPAAAKAADEARSYWLGQPLLQQAGLEVGDRIVEVNGAAVTSWHGLSQALEQAPAGPVELTIERGDQRQTVRVHPADMKVYDCGMRWPVNVAMVEKKSPAAEAGILKDDRIAAVDGKPWPTSETIMALTRAAGASGGTLHLTLWRGGQYLDVTCRPTVLKDSNRPRIGITLAPAAADPVQIGWIEPDGPAARANLRSGDVILRVGEDEVEPTDWSHLQNLLVDAADSPIPIQVRRGEAVVASVLHLKAIPQSRLTCDNALGVTMYEPFPRIYNPIAAVERGIHRALVWFRRVYAMLVQLVMGQVSTASVGGPVLIFQVSFLTASHGLGALMDLWGVLAVSVAVLNFLPIPPFDGGHALFVLIEKIKGRPISTKVRSWIWGVGWILIGALFLFVTYRDILRLVGVA